jgi:two-component system osmolarity sensor histidine kinase EnvZ
LKFSLRPKTLFARTGLILAAALSTFLVFIIIIVVVLILIPIAKQGADDLAVLMIFATDTWTALPPPLRPVFEQELLDNYEIKLTVTDTELPHFHSPLPFLVFLEDALQRRLNKPTHIMQSDDGETWYWFNIPTRTQILQVGIPRRRIGAHPPLAVLLVLLTGTIVSLTTSFFLARRLTRPLVQLTTATEQIAKGGYLEPLPESGPEEMASLVRNFNRMSKEITALLANRTTLLAGISHDLRTPITRVRLALELFPPDTTPDLVEGIHLDLEEMDRLIGQALELARGLDQQPADEIDLRDFVDGIVVDLRRGDANIEWLPMKCCLCVVETLPLRRVVTNLIDNAIRYGEGKPVTVQCDCEDTMAIIQILDRGPGIPDKEREAVFRPFHRLESSRSRFTGGSGLGLAIARQLCEARGWGIQLLPREGGGTNARLVFPIKMEKARVPA